MLEKEEHTMQTIAMTNKEIVQDLLRRIPDDTSLQDIARELEFIAAVRQGLTELDNGQTVSIEEIKRDLPSWITNKTFPFRSIRPTRHRPVHLNR